MFFHPLLLGALGGIVGAKLVTRHHRWGRHRGHWRGPGLFRAVRALGLDRKQKEELFAIAREVRQVFGDVRFGGLQGLDSLVDAVTGDTFDRAGVEAQAARQGDAVAALREKIVQAAEKVHSIFTPEQRQRLRAMLGAAPGFAGGPDAGPYRTAL